MIPRRQKNKGTEFSFLLDFYSLYKTSSLSYQLECPAEYNCNRSHQYNDELLSQKVFWEKNFTPNMPVVLLSCSGMWSLLRQRTYVRKLFNSMMATKDRQSLKPSNLQLVGTLDGVLVL